MPNWKKVITSGSDAVLNEITSSGGIKSTDVNIDGWGSVSASLATLDASIYGDSDVTNHINSLNVVSGSSQITISNTTGYTTFSSSIASDIAAIDSNVTLDDATTNGNTTTNSITIGNATIPSGGKLVVGATTSLPYTAHFKSGSDAQMLLETDAPYDGGAGNVAGFRMKVEDTDDDTRAKAGIFYVNTDSNDWGRGELLFSTDGTQDNGNATKDDWKLKIDGINSGKVSIANALNIGSVPNAGVDTDKFLVLDSNGNVDYRTGAEIASDIGALTTDPTLQEVTDAGATTTNEISTPSLSVGAAGTSISSSLDGATLLIGDLTNSDSTVDIRAYGDGTNAGGRLVISDDSLDFKSAGTSYFQVDSGNVTLDSTLRLNEIANAGTDTDKFLVLDSAGNVDFRTGTQVLSDIGGLELNGGNLTPLQTYIDFKGLSDGHISFGGVIDPMPLDRWMGVWIAPSDGYIDHIRISPENDNSSTDDVDLQLFVNATSNGSPVSVAMGAAGVNKKFTFGSSYSFSEDDRISIHMNKNGNSSDLYAIQIVYRLTN